MACAHPITAYQGLTGGPVYMRRKHPQQRQLQLPCGQCILCRLEQTRQWACRITHEAQKSEANCFATFTINDEHIDEHGSLDYKKHMQPFWKRLRKHLGTRISYYAVGEYGEQTMRPHYHACIFGQDFTEGRRQIRSGEMPLWTNPKLEELWGIGHVSVGVLNFQTASYTAAYCTKKLSGNDGYVHLDDTTGEITWLEQPRAYMSLNPAIGADWIEQWGKHTYAHDQLIINGRPQKPPKYYDKWLKKKSEIIEAMVKDQRMAKAKTHTAEQLHARALNARARTKQTAKSL